MDGRRLDVLISRIIQDFAVSYYNCDGKGILETVVKISNIAIYMKALTMRQLQNVKAE